MPPNIWAAVRSMPGSAHLSNRFKRLERTRPGAVRFAAVFSDESSARDAVALCLAHGVESGAHCRLLRGADPQDAARLPRSAHSIYSRTSLALAILGGALTGALSAGLLGGLFAGVVGGVGGEAAVLQGVATEGAFISGAGFGAALGAAVSGWLAFNAQSARTARRFDITVLRRLRHGDSVVVLSGLPARPMATLVPLLEARCKRWCHDAGARDPL